jgi:hypothetical protein
MNPSTIPSKNFPCRMDQFGCESTENCWSLCDTVYDSQEDFEYFVDDMYCGKLHFFFVVAKLLTISKLKRQIVSF